jgi:hypothetical protein
VDGAAALAAAREKLAGITAQRWPSPLRPLGMLAVLAARDVERGPGGHRAARRAGADGAHVPPPDHGTVTPPQA